MAISPDLDVALCATVFARARRLHIPDFLTPASAEALHRALRDFGDWRLTVNEREQVWDLPAVEVAALSGGQQSALNAQLHRSAEDGFQFVYKTARLSERGEIPDGHPLAAAVALLNSPEFLDLARAITGDAEIAFADAQATCYEAGHFLTRHDDAVAGKNRRAAYVLNLTPAWRAEWGGVLEFLDADGHVAEGYVPSFNALNLFAVPQLHHVSHIAPFARGPRLSITGWLRTRD